MDDLQFETFLRRVSPVIRGVVYPITLPVEPWEQRQQERLMFRNERHLYHRKCDATGKQILSMYRKNAPFPVYSPEAWFGSQWDGRTYGRSFDFNRPFFEQFKELRDVTPHLALFSHSNENADFCNLVGKSRNCYLLFGSINCEDCYYGNPFECKNVADSLVLRNSELCVECIDSTDLYDCYDCQNCNNSRGLLMCFSVDSSENCIACVGLHGKKYYILNKPYTKEEYEKKLAMIKKQGWPALKELKDQFVKLKLSLPHHPYVGAQNENVAGDYIWKTKNACNAYGVSECENVEQVSQLLKSKDIVDSEHGEYGELLYNFMAFFDKVKHSALSYFCWNNVSNLYYCGPCYDNVHHCFGSVGLKKAQYCILNKQYTKEAYEELLPKIIAHMQKTGEWGRFFPPWVSPFAYNETLAQEYFPMSRQDVEALGWPWLGEDTHESYQGPHVRVPDSILDVHDDLCKSVLVCEQTGRLYKIIPHELRLYRQMGLPLPRVCPDQRHLNRLTKRNPRKLYSRQCFKCQSVIQSTYAPDRPEHIYCDSCYSQVLESEVAS